MVTPGMAPVPVLLCQELCSGWAGARTTCPHIPGFWATTGALQNVLVPCPSRISSSPGPSHPSRIPTSRCAWQNRSPPERFLVRLRVCLFLKAKMMQRPLRGRDGGAGMGWLAPVNQQPWKITAGRLGGWKKSVLTGVFRLLLSIHAGR